MLHSILTRLFFLFLLLGILACSENHPGKKPVNPNATQEARDLLNILYKISGKSILSGHHNYSNNLTEFTQRIFELTGKYPVIWGADFSVLRGNTRESVIQEAIRQHQKGSVITLMWHAGLPYRENFDSITRADVWTKISPEEWVDFLSPGTELNRKWLEQIDDVARYLKVLQNENIPVLWRPYHEMNGVWFWWCNKPGKEGFIKLWKAMFDRYVNFHHLDNLIWVWNANAPREIPNDEAYPYPLFYPGPEYVDVLAADVYNNDYKQSHHDQLLELAQGKPIAIGECGVLPTPEILSQQPKWCWFMNWARFINEANTPENVKSLYESERVITLDHFPDLKK